MAHTMTIDTLLTPLVVAAGLAEAGAPARGREEERELVAASQRGEREAFDRLVERYQRDVYRLCYRYVNNHEDANDLAQEAFLKAYRALGRFRGESSFSTWIYRIAVNTCLNFRASRRTNEELPETLPDAAPPAVDRMVDDERARRVRAAVGRLPEKQRATLILKVYQELTHEEVAAIMGATVGTVKANLFHAMANLKKILAASGGE